MKPNKNKSVFRGNEKGSNRRRPTRVWTELLGHLNFLLGVPISSVVGATFVYVVNDRHTFIGVRNVVSSVVP